MLDDRERQIANAAALLSPDDFTADGRPRLDAINPALEAAGVEPLTKEERDDTWDTIVAKATEELAQEANAQAIEAEVKPDAWVRVTQADSNPVALYIEGRCVASLRVGGDAVLLTQAQIAVLRNSGALFTEIAE